MVLDFIWAAAEGLAIFSLLCGAYFVLIETDPVLHFLGKKSAAPLPLSPRDLRSIGRLARHGRDGHSHFGNDMLDTQHQDLFDVTVELRDAILSGRPMSDVDAIVHGLMRGWVKHFQDEEAFLATVGYLGAAKHAAQHSELVDSVAALIKRFRGGRSGIGDLFRFLADDMLAKHTFGVDRDLVPSLQSRG